MRMKMDVLFFGLQILDVHVRKDQSSAATVVDVVVLVQEVVVFVPVAAAAVLMAVLVAMPVAIVWWRDLFGLCRRVRRGEGV